MKLIPLHTDTLTFYPSCLSTVSVEKSRITRETKSPEINAAGRIETIATELKGLPLLLTIKPTINAINVHEHAPIRVKQRSLLVKVS